MGGVIHREKMSLFVNLELQRVSFELRFQSCATTIKDIEFYADLFFFDELFAMDILCGFQLVDGSKVQYFSREW